jgi:prevent-host-death family protein
VRTATAKDLRLRAASLLEEVRRGHEVIITYRGKSVAVLAPVRTVKGRDLNPVGFGMWRDRTELRDVGRWSDKVREPRHGRSSSTRTS